MRCAFLPKRGHLGGARRQHRISPHLQPAIGATFGTVRPSAFLGVKTEEPGTQGKPALCGRRQGRARGVASFKTSASKTWARVTYIVRRVDRRFSTTALPFTSCSAILQSASRISGGLKSHYRWLAPFSTESQMAPRPVIVTTWPGRRTSTRASLVGKQVQAGGTSLCSKQEKNY